MTEDNEYLTFQEFYYAVSREAIGLGYTPYMIGVFKADILDCWNEGKTIEQVVDEVF